MLLTAGERVLLHLLGYWNARDPPEAITQQGIADAARLRRSHVPRTVRALAKEGHVEERDGRVRGRGRKVKLYYLTESGLRRARELARTIEGQEVVADGGPTTIGAFAKSSKRTVLEIVLDLDESGRYRGEAKETGVPAFLGRRDELAALSEWLRSEAPAMVVYGGVGMGTTALARRFVHRVPRPYWWVDLKFEDTGHSILLGLADALAEEGRTHVREALQRAGDPWVALAADLAGFDLLLVFDDYGDLGEDIVDAFARILAAIAQARGPKVLVLAQETTPSYCRFYGRKDVEAGRVREIHLRGLTVEESGLLLGNPRIADEALKRIYLLTKGCPLYLEMIRDGDAQGLKARSRFTTAEVNLLLFSRDVVS